MRFVCLLLGFAGLARAQPRPRGSEETAAQCSDHVDNDRNGLTDCDDPKCSGVARCHLSLISPDVDAPMTGQGQLTAGVIMLLAGPALAGASAAVITDGLHTAGSRRSLELSMGGILTAAGAALTAAGAVFVYKGWRRHKEDVEMGLALAPFVRVHF
jgi:hypothetical protein